MTLAAYFVSIVLFVTAIAEDGWRSLLFNTRSIDFDNLYYLLPGAIATAGALIAAKLSTNRKDRKLGLHRGRGLLRLPWNEARYGSLGSSWSEHAGSTVKTANPMVGWVDIWVSALDRGYAKISDFEAWAYVLTVSLATLPLTLGVHEIAGPEPLIVIVVGAIVTFLCFWLPATYLCAVGVPIDLRRRNPLTAAYLDPTCAHWLRPAAA